MENVIGQLSEKPGEVSGEWGIPNFLSLPEEVDKEYRSPPFFFLDCCWDLSIYPNGQTRHQSEGFVGIFLNRLNRDSPVTVNYSMTAQIADKKEKNEIVEKVFNIASSGWGFPKFLKRSDLQSGERAASPSDTLTVSYTLKSVDRQPLESTLCQRLWRSSLLWNNTLCTQHRIYVELKLKNGTIWVHRAILESSSPVFARMFTTDMQESYTGEVSIEDTEKSVFQVALSYAYCGDPKGLSNENVCEVYKVAHKYEFQELRELCVKLIKKTLSVNTVCDVIALAELYEEKELMESAKDYFAKNKRDILKTEKWKSFKRDSLAIACQVLECVLTGDF